MLWWPSLLFLASIAARQVALGQQQGCFSHRVSFPQSFQPPGAGTFFKVDSDIPVAFSYRASSSLTGVILRTDCLASSGVPEKLSSTSVEFRETPPHIRIRSGISFSDEQFFS